MNIRAGRVLVVGDLILDRYWKGDTHRISPEAPVPVVAVRAVDEFLGGAANVAANIASIGGNVTLIGAVGNDADGATIRDVSSSKGVEPDFVVLEGLSTIVKLRVVSQQQQLVRIDFEPPELPSVGPEILDRVRTHLADNQVLMISDYAKGSAACAPELISLARAAGKTVVVDPKNIDFSIYSGASLLTPNLSEFVRAAGPCGSLGVLKSRALELINDLGLGAILITRGAEGMTLVEASGDCVHLDAHGHEVFDVTGAGDTVCAVVAACLSGGGKLPEAIQLANTAAGLVVSKFGTATVSKAELEAATMRFAQRPQGALSVPELLDLRQTARTRGERVVMTNGCFDVLHEGHVRFLQTARARGDRLIVALNTDESVRKLKGATRPLNCLASRIAVLAALECVDWVVSFEEETPQALIEKILPDLLVKGGDYEQAQIVGRDAVVAAGGQVCVLPYLEGCSTTSLIARLRQLEGVE